MIADIRAGKLVDDTLVADFNYLRTLMGRREIIVCEIMKYDRHKGPGTPGYHDLDGGRNPSDPAGRATSHWRKRGSKGGKEEGGDDHVDH